MIHSLAGVTFLTPDLDAAIAAYDTFLGYRGDAIELVGAVRAQTWGVPQAAAARMITLFPASDEKRFLRLVEATPAPDNRPLASFGWTAAEIVVADVDALAEQLADSPFRIIGPPAILDFEFTDQLKAMQVLGPGGEILYLTEIGGEIPGFALPKAESFVGQLFIMVLAAADIAGPGAFYAGQGRMIGPEILAPIEILSSAHGLPPEYRHRLATIALDDRSLLEVDAYPDGTGPRLPSSIGLPSGIAMVSVYRGEPPDVSSPPGPIVVGAAGEWIEMLG